MFSLIFGDPADAEEDVEAAPRAYRGGETSPERRAEKMVRSPPSPDMPGDPVWAGSPRGFIWR